MPAGLFTGAVAEVCAAAVAEDRLCCWPGGTSDGKIAAVRKGFLGGKAGTLYKGLPSFPPSPPSALLNFILFGGGAGHRRLRQRRRQAITGRGQRCARPLWQRGCAAGRRYPPGVRTCGCRGPCRERGQRSAGGEGADRREARGAAAFWGFGRVWGSGAPPIQWRVCVAAGYVV